MRVRTFHRHTVSRTSTVLGALLPLHLFYSFCFTIPILFIYLGLRWERDEVNRGQKAWMLCLLLVFAAVEAVRFFLGYFANIRMLLPDLIGYMCLCVAPQLVVMCVLFARTPSRNDLEYSVYATQLMMLCVEAVAAANMVVRLARDNTIDFYVKMGAGMPHY